MGSDIDAIVRLTHDFAFFNDTFRIDELAGLFAEEGAFDMEPAGMKRYDGREAVREFFVREQRALSHLFHVTSNHRIDLDGDRATGTVYFLAIGVIRRTGVQNPIHGYYDDVYVRSDDGWRFRSRTTVPLIPFAAVTGSSGS